MVRAVLCGYYGLGNAGDEALLATLLQMLPSSVEPLVLSANPTQTQNLHRVAACDRWNPATVLQALQASQVFIWGGGSLMQDVSSAASPVYYGGLMGLARALGLKTIAWAQGVGPLQRSWTRWLTHQALKTCSEISVRDGRSAHLLQSWNLKCTLAPDPVWALDSLPVGDLWQLPAPRVAVALRPHPQLTAKRLESLSKALVDFQKATETCLLLLPFQPEADEPIAQTIQSQLPGPSVILKPNSPAQLKGVFRGVEMTLAMRFHGLIMAAAEGCRCFALSYDPKVSALMTELGLPGWELADLPSDSSEITRVWLEHYANGDPLSSDQIQSQRDRALMHQDVLIRALAT
ncbi:polysaccharide pyruvyl transferase CsaB [Leptolyngbya sp. FACHB-261]|uniref:polysaccharide pyruvyl transferase CsaB n=1 Tax=Leptolyngbya sp. FACHB-261 TaxID=2692806 RepID=UPI0018EF6597|nr:polysaccharide pyruvyl transferase CsaB [Leptolyngbya sp. FACHB-261]